MITVLTRNSYLSKNQYLLVYCIVPYSKKNIYSFKKNCSYFQTDSQQGAFSSSGSSLSESSIALSHTNKNKSRGALDDPLEFKNKTHETASPSTSSPPPSEDADANNSCFQNQSLEVVLQSGGGKILHKLKYLLFVCRATI